MRKTVGTVLSLAVAMAASAAFAGTAHKASTMKTIEAKGTVESYDATAHKLTIKTKTGAQVFMVSPDTKIFEGTKKSAKAVGQEMLAKETGDHATVKFTEVNGEKTATAVHLSEPAAAKTTPKTTTPKSSAKKY